MLTALNSVKGLLAAYENGANSYIKKPVGADQLDNFAKLFINFPMQSDNLGHHCQGRGKVRLLAHLNLDYGSQILRCTCLQHFCMGIAILTLH